MNDKFYAGHGLSWMRKFLDAIPEKKRYRKSIGFCLACCLSYLYIYKRQPVFKLSHKYLDLFGVNRKILGGYLTLFQQAGLINFEIKQGQCPKVELLLPPIISYNNKQQTITTNNNHTDVQKGTGYMSHRGQVNVPKRTGSSLLKRKTSNKITKEKKKSISNDNKNCGREEGKEIEIGQEKEQDNKKLRKEVYKKVRKEGRE